MDKNAASNQTSVRVVFVATDLSPLADVALRQAHERAKAANAKLVVCHVVHNLMSVNMLFPQRYQEETDARAELHRQTLHALAERMRVMTGRGASEFEPLVDEGTPYAKIVEQAERAGADLIVVGDRGVTDLSRMLLGSVAEKVVRYAHAPVLVARYGAKTGAVLVATDLSEQSLPAVAAAAREARREGVRVTALHCIEPPSICGGPGYAMGWRPEMSPGFLDEERDRSQEKLTEALQRFELQGDQQVVVGSPAATIVSTAEKLHAELVIVGTRGTTGVQRVLIGSVAESVVRHAPCSVLVVRLVESGGA